MNRDDVTTNQETSGASRPGSRAARPPAAEALHDLAMYLRHHRIRFGTELDMQQDVGQFVAADIARFGGPVLPEFALGDAGRIDFYLQIARIGIECKVQGSNAAVLSQLLRYADHPLVAGLVLVTRRRQHRHLPHELRGKPLEIVWVAGVF